MARQPILPKLTLLRPRGFVVVFGLVAACEGTIGEPGVFLPGQGLLGPDAGMGSTPDSGSLGGPEFDPFAAGGATIGVICGSDGPQGRLVLTEEPATCARHAELLSGAPTDSDRAVVSIPVVTGPVQLDRDVEICLDGLCATRTIRVEVDTVGPAGAIGRWSIPLLGRTAGGTLQATSCVYDEFLPGRDPNLVPNLSISEVALYQSVKVPLAASGAEVTRSIPVVEGRPGLLRVFVEPQVGFLQREVNAELRLDQGNGPKILTESLTVAIASREATLGTTFNFPLAAEDVGPTTTWSVSLKAPEGCTASMGDTSGARFPTSGQTALASERIGRLQVVLVPMRYNADGSGRLPVTSPAQVEIYRETLFSMFPVEGVDITVREPVDLNQVVTGASSTWSPVLQQLLQVRANDNPPSQAYYYGIFRPQEGEGWSGTAGLAPLARAPDVSRRGGIGLGNAGVGAARTCAHELGHAAGRAHAPCGGAGNPDPNYPYPDGSIGVWGYNVLADRLIDPAIGNDLMGYCQNDWISDYNYRALAQRYSFVNQSAPLVVGPPTLWRSIVLGADGSHHWGEVVEYPEPPYGEEAPVRYIGPNVSSESSAVIIRLDHGDDVIALMPAAPSGTVRVEIYGRSILY